MSIGHLDKFAAPVRRRTTLRGLGYAGRAFIVIYIGLDAIIFPMFRPTSRAQDAQLANPRLVSIVLSLDGCLLPSRSQTEPRRERIARLAGGEDVRGAEALERHDLR